jgi:competence protein ComFC
VIPVSADEPRVAEREVDVVQVIARQLAERVGLPIRADLLKGASGSGHSRHLGSGNSIQLNSEGGHLRDLTVLLVDDIVTLGFTAKICAELLKSAGAAKVCLLVLAR